MTTTDKNPLLTFAIVAGCSICFCSKGVFIKLSFLGNAEPMTVLALRMIMALPVFLGVALVLNAKGEKPFGRRDWWAIIGFGFIGYYFSPMVNFVGLQYVSVGLERMILYTYPTFVVIGGMVLFGQRVTGATWLAVLMTYFGVFLAYSGEVSGMSSTGAVLYGASLILVSTLSYSFFVLYSGSLIKTFGAMRFTANVLCVSCGFTILHFLLADGWGNVREIESQVYQYTAVLALFGTVLPAFLMGIGLARAGAQRFAVMSTVGPVTTVVLAWALLGESINGAQFLGLIVTVSGGLMISLLKNKPAKEAVSLERRSVSRA